MTGTATGQQSSPQPNVGRLTDIRKFSLRFWALTIVTGVGAGIGGGLLMRLLFLIQSISWPQGPGDFQDAVARASAWRHLAVMLFAGLIAGFGRQFTRRLTGGHAGELAQTIWFRAGKFAVTPTFAKAILSIVIVGMGAAIGREGALKQTGAAIASKLSDWTKMPPPQRRLLAACGAGAGMAAAYNVPFGGALFALEALLGTLSLPLALPALACSVVATAVSWIFLPTRPTYDVPAYTLSLQQIAWAMIVGPIFGFASLLYIRLIGWADKRKPKGASVVLAPVVVFTLLGLASLVLPQLLGNGKELVERALTAQLPLSLLAILLILRPLATASCLGAGAPGGLFTPTVTTGALLGGTLGHIWRLFAGGGTPGTFAQLGAGAMLSATTQAPISSVVLMLEMTGHAEPLLAPLLIAVTLATVVSRRIEAASIYAERVNQDETKALEQSSKLIPPGSLVLPASASYGRVVRRLLQAVQRNALLFAVDEDGALLGQISPEAAEDAERSPIPMDTSTAGDLAQQTPEFNALVRSKLLNKHEQFHGDTA